MMYYNTPDVHNYQNFLVKHRLLIIVFYLLVTILTVSLYKPQVVATDELFWLKESQTLQETKEKAYETNYVSRLSITVDTFDAPTLEKIHTLLQTVAHHEGVNYIDSLFNKQQIYKAGNETSTMIKTLELSSLSAEDLKELINNLPKRFTGLIEPNQVKLHFYIYSDKAITLTPDEIGFEYSFSQPNSYASIKDYLIYLGGIIFTIVLLFRLIFKNYFSSFIALVIIIITFLITVMLTYFVTGMSQFHIAMPLIIIAISLVDYLYFYYRWHVSQYKADLDRAMTKTLNRNLYPAFWTSFITVIGLGGLLFVDSAIVSSLSLSIMSASTITYLLNITLFPALASFFVVKHPKVGFGRFCYFFANHEMHYNHKFLILFLFATLVLSGMGVYKVSTDSGHFFTNTQKSGIITANIEPFEVSTEEITLLNSFEQSLKEEFGTSIKMDSITSLVQALHHANYPDIAINDDYILEALMYVDMYNFNAYQNPDGSYKTTIAFDAHQVNKSALLQWIQNQKMVKLYFTDIDSLTSFAKADTTVLITASLATAMVLIGLILSRIFRSKEMAMIGFVVNATPIVWLGFIIHIFNLPFTFEVLIAMSIALALGSDATVHFAYKYSRARYYGRTQKHSLEIMFFYGGIPVIIGSIILIFAFLLLTFTHLYTLQLIGIYGAVLMLLSLATDLLILPVFLLAFDKYYMTKSKSDALDS